MPFKPTSKDTWLSKTEADLKGRPLSDLDFVITDSIRQAALTHQDDLSHAALEPLIGAKSDNQWKIGELIPLDKGEKIANEMAIAALEGGATALAFHHGPTLDLSQLLQGINLEWISTSFHGEQDLVADFVQIAKQEKKQDLSLIQCGFYNTPVNKIASYYKELPLGRFQIIQTEGHQDVAEEIAALALAYTTMIEQIEEEDIEVLNALTIQISMTDLFLVNVSKIRALKLILAQIQDAYGIQVDMPQLRATIAKEAMTEDADYNKIKMMPHALSALIGGVDELFLPPSTTASEQASFNHRISRNINHLLELESFMDRVIDPAAGSYYIETLTDKIATQSWSIFQQKHKQA